MRLTPVSAERLTFRKSSYSTPQNCVEVADVPGGDAAIRDSQNPHLGYFVVSGPEWTTFLDSVKHRGL